MENGASSYRRFLEGDETALLALVTQYRPGLRAYLYAIVQDWDLADDLTQETFVKLCLKRPKDTGRAGFKTWLYAIGRNLAIDQLRRRAAHPYAPLEAAFDLTDGMTPEAQLLRAEQAQQIHAALRALVPQHRQVLYLTYFEGFDTAQLAKIMHRSNHNVSALLYRAKAALKTELEKEGFHYEE